MIPGWILLILVPGYFTPTNWASFNYIHKLFLSQMWPFVFWFCILPPLNTPLIVTQLLFGLCPKNSLPDSLFTIRVMSSVLSRHKHGNVWAQLTHIAHTHKSTHARNHSFDTTMSHNDPQTIIIIPTHPDRQTVSVSQTAHLDAETDFNILVAKICDLHFLAWTLPPTE